MAASDAKDEVHHLLKELNQVATVYADHGHDDARQQLRRITLKLASSLESPVDSHDRTLFEVSDQRGTSSCYRAIVRLLTAVL